MNVVRWQNGLVMAFDEKGEQVQDLQGLYEEVRDRVLAAAHASTVFEHGVWGGEPKSLTRVRREEW